MQMQVVINQHDLRMKELYKYICIYARENIDWIDFDSDKQALQYFADFAENATVFPQ